jgi:hypothetical protein
MMQKTSIPQITDHSWSDGHKIQWDEIQIRQKKEERRMVGKMFFKYRKTMKMNMLSINKRK